MGTVNTKKVDGVYVVDPAQDEDDYNPYSEYEHKEEVKQVKPEESVVSHQEDKQSIEKRKEDFKKVKDNVNQNIDEMLFGASATMRVFNELYRRITNRK